MKSKTKPITYCQHHWMHIPMLGNKKYMCTECHIFGFKIKSDPFNRIQEHSAVVSDDLLEQYMALGCTAEVAQDKKPRGPKPCFVRPMRMPNGCTHTWVHAPEFEEVGSPQRFKCENCGQIGKRTPEGDTQPYSKSYEENLYRYWVKRTKAKLMAVVEQANVKEN